MVLINCFRRDSIIFLALLLCIKVVNVSSLLNRSLESGKVCGINSHRGEILLGKDEASAALVYEKGFFSSWTGRYNYACNFTVGISQNVNFLDTLANTFKTKKSEGGIYAVIQNLSLRKNSQTGECIDYIRFRMPGGQRPKYKEYCGFLRLGVWSDDSDYSDDDDIYQLGPKLAPNAFVFHGDELKVDLFVSDQRLAPGERLIINVVFTSFKKVCPSRNTIQCKPSECIWSGFKNDGYQNCPYETCADEESCMQDGVDRSDDFEMRFPKSSGIGTKVTMGAVASIITMLALFAACLCICKRFGCLCWGTAQAHRPPIRPQHEVERVLPSAPMEIETKDLPPSYDSLFPSTQS